MKMAIDSSSLAKRYVQEAGSERLDHLLAQASELALCVIVVPEIISGLNRRLREGVFTTADYQAIKRQLLDDLHDATVLQITPSVVSRSIKLLEQNVLRAMDALHVACALEGGVDFFVTSDRNQFLAARNSGIRAEYIG